MGAYENPKIIVPPDYGEIFRKNFEASKRMVEDSFARAEARREKIKKQEQQIDDRILQFDLTRQEIKAGDLTTSLQNATNFLTDDYAENERNRDNISREEYNEKRLSLFRKLNEMKQIGAVLSQQSKEYKNFDKSKFQKNGGVANGLFDAYEKGEVKFQFVGDDIEMYYKNGEDLIIVDTDNIKEGDFFNINEKFVIDEKDKKAFVQGIQLTESFQTTTTKDGKQTTQSLKTYSKDKSELINDIASSSEMNAYFSDIEDAGSIFVDSVYNPGNLASLQSSADIIVKKYGLSEEEAKQFKTKISEGSYDEILIGKDKNYRELVNEVSKLELAKESFEKYAPKEQRGRATAQAAGGTQNNITNTKYYSDFNKISNYLLSVQKSGQKEAKSKMDAIMNNPNLSQEQKTIQTYPLLSKIMTDKKITLEDQAEALRSIGVQAYTKNDVLARFDSETEEGKANINQINQTKASMYVQQEGGKFKPLISIRNSGNSLEGLIRAYGETLPAGQLTEFNKIFGSIFGAGGTYQSSSGNTYNIK
jgi:hypothetical protein